MPQWIQTGPRRLAYAGKCFVTGAYYSTREVSQLEVDTYLLENVDARSAFPELSAEDREFIISGTSPAGWAKLFPAGIEGPILDDEEALS